MKHERIKVFMNGQAIFFATEVACSTVDARGQASAVAPNFVHSCDASHLMRVSLASWQVGIRSLAVIHDSFGTHACDTARLSLMLRETMVEQYTPDILKQMRDGVKAQLPPSVGRHLPEPPRLGPLDLAALKAAQYAFA